LWLVGLLLLWLLLGAWLAGLALLLLWRTLLLLAALGVVQETLLLAALGVVQEALLAGLATLLLWWALSRLPLLGGLLWAAAFVAAVWPRGVDLLSLGPLWVWELRARGAVTPLLALGPVLSFAAGLLLGAVATFLAFWTFLPFLALGLCGRGF
jgi:hypothetical protein